MILHHHIARLATSAKVEILELLEANPDGVRLLDLAAHLGITGTNASNHLRQLTAFGAVEKFRGEERVGRQRPQLYRLDRRVLAWLSLTRTLVAELAPVAPVADDEGQE